MNIKVFTDDNYRENYFKSDERRDEINKYGNKIKGCKKT